MITQTEFNELTQIYHVLDSLNPILRQKFMQESCRFTAIKGQVLFDAGSSCQNYPLLIDGMIRITKRLKDGRKILVYRLQPGDSCILTTSCLLGGSQYTLRGSLKRMPEAFWFRILCSIA